MATIDGPRGSSRPSALPWIAAGVLLLIARFVLEATIERPPPPPVGGLQPPGIPAPAAPLRG